MTSEYMIETAQAYCKVVFVFVLRFCFSEAQVWELLKAVERSLLSKESKRFVVYFLRDLKYNVQLGWWKS